MALDKEEFRRRENERKRRWRANKKKEKSQGPAKPGRYKNVNEVHTAMTGEKLYTKEEVKGMLLDLMKQNMPPPAPVRLSHKELKHKKKLERMEKKLQVLKGDADENRSFHQSMQRTSGSLIPPESAKYPITTDEALRINQAPHLVGKRIQFAPDTMIPRPAIPTKKRLRIRRKAKKVFTDAIPEALPPGSLPDITEEQVEKPQTTQHCPESIGVEGLNEVKKNPEYFIEINMVTNSRVVDTFYIPAESRKFHYKTKEYKIDEETIYLLPTKLGLFMPTCHYKEGSYQPQGFRQTNKGITGKALSLLYMEQLYTSLLYSEDIKYNLFIVILSIASLIAYALGMYFLFFHQGGLLAPTTGGGGGVIQLIMPWRFMI